MSIEVHADKNVHYSEADDAFIHYKQNHFQITTEIPWTMTSPVFFLGVNSMLVKVDTLFVEVYAVKSKKQHNFGEREERVALCQAGKSRTKDDTQPAEPCEVMNGKHNVQNKLTTQGKTIHARLRFQSSTSHNARTKTNEVNPNQEYFRLVVAVWAISQSQSYLICAKVSGPLIVRGQNPGRYGSQKKVPVESPQLPTSVNSTKEDSTVFMGKVGINTDQPQVNTERLITLFLGSTFCSWKYHGFRKYTETK